MSRDHHIADIGLADEGRLRVEWAGGQMHVINALRDRFAKEQPFTGITIGACLHVTTETANLVQALRAGGAEVLLCASNPLSTQDDTAAYLASEGVSVFAVRGEDHDTYYTHIRELLDRKPQFTVDDGADLVSTIHRERPEQAESTIGGTEETTTGVIRLRQMAVEGALKYPIVAINDTPTKHLFDNRFGTGQSALDGIIRATNVLIAGKNVVISGFGDCGRGVAARAQGFGANVIVTEVDEIRALEAVMDGYRVMPMAEAAQIGDIFCTVTGDRDIIRTEHIEAMKDGAIISNAGHFDIEIDVAGLRKMAKTERTVRRNVEEFELSDGRRIRLLAEGRLVNLGAAEGHPAAVMDMSFAGQALTLHWLTEQHREGKRLEAAVHSVPADLDAQIARVKLQTMGIEIDTLTPEQQKYLESWQEGDIARYATLGELCLGFEGLALLRRLVDGPDDAMADRLAEIKRIADRLDRPLFAGGLHIEELDPRTGYAASASGYDTSTNPLIEAEHPIVVDLVAKVGAGRALDAACGTGRHAKHLAERHETYGVDASPEMLEVARAAAPTATFQTGDLESLPFPDAHFDVVVCALALCHLGDLRAAVVEIGRVAQPGAKVVLTDPHPQTVAIISHLFVPKPDGSIGFVRNHNRLVGEYLRAFDAAGLRVVDCLEPPVPESGLTGGLAGPYVPGAMRQALEGLPQAIIWELERT